ncbi:MAG: AAA family ATPase [Eubacterium sp.]
MENAFYQGFYDEMSSFVRFLFESAFKTNDSLAFAVITGCLRISRKSIFTGFNNLTINSILSADYGEYFGFTPVEVERMLDYYQLDSKKEEARTWYDGYLFGNSEVYNPWSIINYVREACADIHTLQNHTGFILLRIRWCDLIEQADVSTRQEIEKLINGACIEKPLHEDITYDAIHKNMDNLWNFLFFTGYLKKCGERLDQENIYTTLTIPNAEIRYL